jgi:hypothetical protein
MEHQSEHHTARTVPRLKRPRRSYDESADEAPNTLENEPVEVEREGPAEENEPVESLGDDRDSEPPAFED